MITIRSIRSAVVRRSDEFSFTEEPPTVRHVLDRDPWPAYSPIVGTYVIVALSDDSTRVWHFETHVLDVATYRNVTERYPEESYKGIALNFALITLAKEGIFRS